MARAVFESRRTVDYNPRLLVIRGISDLLLAEEAAEAEGSQIENNEQRRIWKVFAAAAAATFAAAVISRFVASPDPRAGDPPDQSEGGEEG